MSQVAGFTWAPELDSNEPMYYCIALIFWGYKISQNQSRKAFVDINFCKIKFQAAILLIKIIDLPNKLIMNSYCLINLATGM